MRREELTLGKVEGQLVPFRSTTVRLPSAMRAETRPISDLEIVAGMARGEDWAAAALYDRVYVVVERTLRRVLRSSAADQDDLIQTVFEKLVLALTSRKLPESCNLAAWASVTSTRAAIDWMRRRASERRLFEVCDDPDHALGAAGCLERQLEARSTVTRFHRVLTRLSPKYAEVVLLHDVLGHDLSEIATTTDVSVAAAQSRLVRGRKALLTGLRAEGLFT
jgi:RNA polymerase sigma-70 factor (ECF subfamily)